MPRAKEINLDFKYYPKTLMKKLEYIKRCPMTLLEADSGFGKTTIMRHFFKNTGLEDAVFDIHEFKGDSPAQAWGHFCRMISLADRESAERLRAIGEPGEDTVGEIAQTLRGLTCERETFLFLDDYQEWKLYRPMNSYSVCPGRGRRNYISWLPRILTCVKNIRRHRGRMGCIFCRRTILLSRMTILTIIIRGPGWC